MEWRLSRERRKGGEYKWRGGLGVKFGRGISQRPENSLLFSYILPHKLVITEKESNLVRLLRKGVVDVARIVLYRFCVKTVITR